jgi:predicted DNA-binding helix-hairpin-helix protein
MATKGKPSLVSDDDDDLAPPKATVGAASLDKFVGTKPKMKRLTLDIEAGDHKELKRLALEEDTDMVKLMTQWMREKLAERREK